jgi:hypothetical protein
LPPDFSFGIKSSKSPYAVDNINKELKVQIYINEQELDFTLEDEKYFADIYRSVSDWLLKSGMQVLSIRLNDDDEKITEIKKLMTMPLDGISRIEIEADKENDGYSALIEYFQVYIDALLSGNSKVLTDLQKEYKYVNDVLVSYLGDADDAIIKKMGELIGKNDGSEELLKLITYCCAKLKDFYKEQTFPHSELSATVLLMEKQLEEYCNISVYLQTGKEKEAYQLILYFIEYAQKVIRIVNYLKTRHKETVLSGKIGDYNEESFFLKFSAILKELVDGFENEDIIQIGDLIEYEIVPMLEMLIGEIKANNG